MGGRRGVRVPQQGDRRVERLDGGAARPEGGLGHHRPDHHLREGAGRRLLHALHEPWHQHPLQEATEETTGPVLLPLPLILGRVDLHGGRLPWGLHPTIHPR